MKKIMFLITLMLALAAPSFAGQIVLLPVRVATTSTINISGTATIYTTSMDISDANVFGISFKTAAPSTGGASNVTIQVQQSFQLPSTEETTDVAWGSANTFSTVNIPNNLAGTGSTLTGFSSNGTWFSEAITFAPTKYARFKITSTGNATDSTLQMYVSKKYDV